MCFGPSLMISMESRSTTPWLSVPCIKTPSDQRPQASILRFIGAVLLEQSDDWQASSRYMMVEAFAQIDKEGITPILSITTKAA